MEFLKSLLCFIPWFGRRNMQSTEIKTITELRRDKMQKVCRLKTSLGYQLKRDRILGNISFDYSRIVVVWGYGANLYRASVVSKLHTYGKVTFLQDQWKLSEKGIKLWRGVLVEYARNSEAENAAYDMPSQIRYARATMLETVINTLADCELLHPECRDASSKVVIYRKVPLRVEEVDDLHRKLHTFGPLVTFYINNRLTTLGATCEATYVYLTQAYLAMIMTNGFMFRRGIITAVIEKTEKDRDILQNAKDCIILLSQCCFPS